MPRPVIIVDYDPHWPILYEQEKSRILKLIGHKASTIEHVGSTAVPGLGGKPIVDIMAGVHNSADAEECVPLLQNLGYVDVAPQPDEPDWYYCLGKTCQVEDVRLSNYHLHLVRFTSYHWEKHLLFRDFLRAHPDAAQQYFRLKKRLAAKHGSDRIGYTEAKTSFIETIVAQARKRLLEHRTDRKDSSLG
jgi:GrpB-like predicted nucleotidyltransferase (UPF0157 family)